MTKYIKRHLNAVDAVKYDGIVDESIINLLQDRNGLYFWELNDLYIYNERNKPKKVREGDMIVLYSNGLLGVIDEDEFYAEYKELHYEGSQMDLAVSAKPSGLFID